MVNFAQFKSNFQENIVVINQKINAFVSFVVNKLKNYKNLTLGEQIAYACTGLGLVLILASIVLFLL